MTWRTSSSEPRARRRVRLYATARLDRLPSPPAEPIDDGDDDLHDAVRGAVAAALTDKQREVVELYFFEGLSQGEIGRRLGVTQQVVHKRIFGAGRDGRLVGGALGRLRAALGPLAAARGFAPARP